MSKEDQKERIQAAEKKLADLLNLGVNYGSIYFNFPTSFANDASRGLLPTRTESYVSRISSQKQIFQNI